MLKFKNDFFCFFWDLRDDWYRFFFFRSERELLVRLDLLWGDGFRSKIK